MANWNPQQYLQFKKDRLRPAHELIMRLGDEKPGNIIDLGCGPGTSTTLLGERFRLASIIGVDNSDQMLLQARKQYPKGAYVNANISGWHPQKPVDLIFSNAVFHWLPDHQKLLTRLAAFLNPGGRIAVQMPDNLGEPSHQAIAEIAGSDSWRELLAPILKQRTPLANESEYYDWLSRDYHQIDIWRVSYSHIMPGYSRIVEWVKGAALTPFLDVLDPVQQEVFLAQYLQLLKTSYPAQEDDQVIYNFPRLFFVARKK